MRRVPTGALALLFMSAAFRGSPAGAEHPKDEHKAVHAKPGHPHDQAHAEHARKEAEKKREHEAREKKEQARKEAEKKREHEAREKKEKEAHARKEAEKKREHEAREKKEKEEHARKEAEKKRELAAREKRIVDTIHKAIKHMWRGDHDYDDRGHEAHVHLRAALHELHAPDVRPTGEHGDMTQAQSDALIRQGLEWLQPVRGELSSKGAPPHHAAALRQVDAAMSKLLDALRIR
jgi:flagellar biosynthesis GTPase FlhF